MDEPVTWLRSGEAPTPPIPGYEYIETTNAGAAAHVHRYRQTATGMDVAVKITRRPLDERTRERFTAETHLMARVSAHPFILTILDAGMIADGRGYLVLEYAPGGSYGQVLRRRRLGVQKALDLGVRLGGALETAHRAGIIHRDIKPGNILVTRVGLPALGDFGISATIYDSHLQTGFSLPWAPPEVVGQREDTERSDIYSLAATVFAAITGASPYEYAYGPRNSTELEALILSRDAPPLDGPDAPPIVSRTLATAMSRIPDDRYPTALTFARALQAAQMSCFDHVTPLVVSGEPRYPQAKVPSPALRPAPMPVQETIRRRLLAVVTVAAAVAVVVALCLAFVPPIWPSRGSQGRNSTTIIGGMTSPTSSSRTPGGAQVESQSIPAPTNLSGRYLEDAVTFSWTNPDPRHGDTYAWAKVGADSSSGSAGTAIVDTTSISITAPGEDQICIQVSIVRSDRRMSQQPAMACAARQRFHDLDDA